MTQDIQKTLDKLRAKTVFQIGFEGAPNPVRQEQEPSALNLEAAALIERLAGALEEVDRQLTNGQPHIASIADRYGMDAIAFIDPHIDMAIESARRALSGEPTP